MSTEDRKDQILKIATNIFYRDGYEKASLQEIAQKAGITKAAIYHHFNNKEEILFTLVSTLSDKLIFDLKEIVKCVDDPVEKLRQLMSKQISYMNPDKANVKILIEDRRLLSKRFSEVIKSKMEEVIQIYRDILVQIRDIGMLKDVNMFTANFTVLAVINWLYHWYNPKGKLSIEEIVDNIIKIIFYGLIQDRRDNRL
jgi:AcrR family transcriptional regulator